MQRGGCRAGVDNRGAESAKGTDRRAGSIPAASPSVRGGPRLIRESEVFVPSTHRDTRGIPHDTRGARREPGRPPRAPCKPEGRRPVATARHHWAQCAVPGAPARRHWAQFAVLWSQCAEPSAMARRPGDQGTDPGDQSPRGLGRGTDCGAGERARGTGEDAPARKARRVTPPPPPPNSALMDQYRTRWISASSVSPSFTLSRASSVMVRMPCWRAVSAIVTESVLRAVSLRSSSVMRMISYTAMRP